MKVLALYALLAGEWGIERILVLILSKIHQWRRLHLHPHHRLAPHHVRKLILRKLMVYGYWLLIEEISSSPISLNLLPTTKVKPNSQ